MKAYLSKSYIGGDWVDAQSQAVFDVYNPADQSLIAQVPDLDRADALIAITYAEVAQKSWQEQSPEQRSNWLMAWHDAVLDNKESLARLVTQESGKPIHESLGEVAYGASFIRWFAEEARRTYGEVIPSPQDRLLMVEKAPVGVCAAITPWNFPIAMITRKAAPALAAGCSILIKPAESTPLSALYLGYLAQQAGLPDGLIQVLTASKGKTLGEVLTSDPRVRKFSFTGSTQVGRVLLAQCAQHVKRVSMELGGNAPFIVFDDADIDLAVKGAIAAKFRNSGQTCVCSNRILVQAGIFEAFSTRFVEEVRDLRIGNGMDESTQIGPLINQAAVEKAKAHVQDALKKGAKLAHGGEIITGDGYFFQPTVLTEVTTEMMVAKEETFGPVAPLFKFEDEQDAIEIANATEFGLAAYFYSQNMSRCMRVSRALEYGMVGVNEGIISTTVAPFGGVKESGLGREGARQGILEYLEDKYVCFGGLSH